MAVIAKYKFNSTLYADLVPEFNAEFTNYTVTDEATETDSEGNVIKTRVIEHDTLLPTLMRFGRVWVDGESTTDNKTDSLLEVLDMNTSELTNCSSMFRYNTNLTSISCKWDTSNVIDMNVMFAYCYNLTSLDVSNFNTSKVNNMRDMFYNCNNLTSLDVSNFDTSKVTTMRSMFYNCNNLTSLDVSNWNTSNVINMSNIFINTSKLSDIGMLYCSQSTINILSSNITTPSTNVWVEGGMIDDLTSYDNVTYKAYYWEKEVLLNSPLLEGDKIVKKDGKIYHYHKMGMVVLDGSEDWYRSSDADTEDTKRYSFSVNSIKRSGFIICDNIGTSPNYTEIFPHNVANRIDIKHYYLIDLRWSDISSLKQWLQQNPTTVVYELAKPWYELISDTSDDLSLSLVSEDNIISNNSLIPTNMNVKNKGMSTVAMNTSTKYTVAFDKDADSSVTIDLCGSTIDTTDNVVEITTPSELANDEITFIGDCEVSNVRILEGSVSGDAIPKESFEGLKNSFEDGKLPNPLYTHLDEFTITRESSTWGHFTDSDSLFVNNRVYTLFMEVLENSLNNPLTWEITQTYVSSRLTVNPGQVGIFVGKVDAPGNSIDSTVWVSGANEQPSGEARIGRCYALEGDWTHLTEEDWNNLGKYKVEYKVVGKNKATLQEEGAYYYYSSGCKMSSTTHNGYIASVEPNKTYIVSFEESISRTLISNLCFWDSSMYFIGGSAFNEGDGLTFTTSHNTKFITIAVSNRATAFQIEEGTVATEYEPYKEYTKTFYLNSPLLEGDTIEDVNGVATHVKRYGKVVLDGDNSNIQWNKNDTPSYDDSLVNFFTTNVKGTVSGVVLSDKLPFDSRFIRDVPYPCIKLSSMGNLLVNLKVSDLSSVNSTGVNQWLSNNPITVVYQLASPIYEPISTESILCDSYVNGHLDVDSNIPIEKVQFSRTPNISTKYLYPNTPYVLQFESDNIGKLNLSLANCYTEVDIIKGVNKISLPLADIPHNYLVLNGIGFNASNIQVVATDRDNIGYFKGIQSSFEDKLIVSENLFDVNNIIINSMVASSGDIQSTELYNRTDYIECKPNTPYTCNYGTGINYYDKDKVWLEYLNHDVLSPFRAKYLIKNINKEYNINTYEIKEVIEDKYEVKVTLEDENGVISNEFIYLNSPLLKGDKIEMYNGKLCHYHKMGKVVLDGSDSLNISPSGYNSNTTTCKRYYIKKSSNDWFDAPKCYPLASDNIMLTAIYCDKIPTIDLSTTVGATEYNGLGISLYAYKDYNNPTYQQFRFVIPSSIGETVENFKQWLQENPTTVVYELAEPYYEDITPIQNEFVITSIGESSFTIDSGAIPTDGEITYSVNVKLLNDLEESINNNTSSTDTDLSTILDDIINE